MTRAAKHHGENRLLKVLRGGKPAKSAFTQLPGLKDVAPRPIEASRPSEGLPDPGLLRVVKPIGPSSRGPAFCILSAFVLSSENF
jgi:hypothetical protein